MSEQQTHLKSALEQRETILKEIQELNTQITNKRELGLKVQGIIEYLEQVGVTLEEETEEASAEAAPTEVVEEGEG